MAKDGAGVVSPAPLDERLTALKAEIAALRGSRSWHLTAPLRALGEFGSGLPPGCAL